MNKKSETAVATIDEAELAEFSSLRKGSQKTRINNIILGNSKIDKEGGLDPSFGKLTAISYDGENELMEVVDIKTAEFFPILFRVQIRCKDYDEFPDGKKARYWCNETDEGEDIVLKNTANETVYEGPYKEAKERFNLQYLSAIYVWYNEKIYRWKISGASFDTWFTVKKIVGGNRPLTFKIKAINPQQNGTVWYNEIIFEVGKEFPIQKAIELTKTVNATLSSYYQKKELETMKKELQIEEAKHRVDEVPEINYKSSVRPEDVLF
jgi:hypothetical protein